MNFYCNRSIESIQSCDCRCRTACFCPCRPCCCKKHVVCSVVKKRSRFGDIFKGQTPNLEDLNYYRNKKKKIKTGGVGGKGGKGKKKGAKGFKKKKGAKGKNKGGKQAQGGGIWDEVGGKVGDTVAVVVGGDYDGKPLGEGGKWDKSWGNEQKGGTYGGLGGIGGGEYRTGNGGAAYGGAGYGGAGYGGAGYGGAGRGGAGYGGAGYGEAGIGGTAYGGGGYGGVPGQGGSAGDGGAYGANKTKWREPNECRPNQSVKCPYTCTLKPKKCMPNQIGPCHEACLKGTPYDDPKVFNYPGMGLGNQPLFNSGGGLYCAQGGLQGNHTQIPNGAFNYANQSWPPISQTAPLQTNVPFGQAYQNFLDISSTAPPYCSPRNKEPFYSGAQGLSQYCGPQTQGSVFPDQQNFGNVSPIIPQNYNTQILGGYSMQPPQYPVNPLLMYCQSGGLQGYTNNPLSHQQYYTGVQQLQSISPNYGGPPQSTTSPRMISNYLQGGDGLQDSCPAVRSITCKICGKERKFVQTLYIKPHVDTTFTTKDVKTKCSQT